MNSEFYFSPSYHSAIPVGEIANVYIFKNRCLVAVGHTNAAQMAWRRCPIKKSLTAITQCLHEVCLLPRLVCKLIVVKWHHAREAHPPTTPLQ